MIETPHMRFTCWNRKAVRSQRDNLVGLSAFLLLVAMAAPLASAQPTIGGETLDCNARPGMVAMVVSNSTYTGAMPPLPSTREDGRLVAQALCARGFRVRVLHDLDRASFLTAQSEFAATIRAAGRDSKAFFYYSGHGAVARPGGSNYLIPAFARPTSRLDIESKGISGDALVKAFDDAAAQADSEALVVVFDACRNLAFPGQTMSGEGGWNAIPRRPGRLLAYSTPAGQTALADNTFSRELATQLQVSQSDLATIFHTVQTRVFNLNGQLPWLDVGLTSTVLLPSARGAGPAPPQQQFDREATFWEGCCANAPNDSSLKPRLEDYLRRVNAREFSGRFADEARRRLTLAPAPAPQDPCRGLVDRAALTCVATEFWSAADRNEIERAWEMTSASYRAMFSMSFFSQVIQSANVSRGRVDSRNCVSNPAPMFGPSGRPVTSVSCLTRAGHASFADDVTLEKQPNGQWKIAMMSILRSEILP